MPFTPILAHGALGAFDEIIFLGVAAIFLVMMGVSWFTSRNSAQNTDLETNDTTATADAVQANHVTLD